MKSLTHQVAIALSLTIVTRDNGRVEYFTFPLLFITRIFLLLWRLWPFTLWAINRATICYKLAQIAFNSLCFALQKTYAGNPIENHWEISGGVI